MPLVAIAWTGTLAMFMHGLTLGGCATVDDTGSDPKAHAALDSQATSPTAKTADKTADLLDVQALWDYGDPAGSEQRFRDALGQTGPSANATTRAVLLTQIARTYSLRRMFDDAHALLDDVEPMLAGAGPAARVRYLLERGRTINSSGQSDRALPLFEQAWTLGRDAGIDGLAVDAAHMCAIVASGEDALRWNELALQLAESSADQDARRWRGSLHNNIGWAHHDSGDFDAALASFERALHARLEQSNPGAGDVRVARWCIGRCLRSLGKLDDALAVQRYLERTAPDGSPDGYVCEELAECLHALNRTDEARPYFSRAYELLLQDDWLAESEPLRLERLKQLGDDGQRCES